MCVFPPLPSAVGCLSPEYPSCSVGPETDVEMGHSSKYKCTAQKESKTTYGTGVSPFEEAVGLSFAPPLIHPDREECERQFQNIFSIEHDHDLLQG